MKKPEWIKRSVDLDAFNKMNAILNELKINTVCFNASCPNIGQCFRDGTATFLILGNICTRNCLFCGITSGNPDPINESESQALLEAINRLNIRYVIITSVTRDDLKDHGNAQFIDIVKKIRDMDPNVKVELLIPDFKGDEQLLQNILDVKPDVIAHNIETVSRLYPKIRPNSNYETTKKVLKFLKERDPNQIIKTGFMAGLGETWNELIELINEIKLLGCDVLTIGQYLQPSKEHLNVKKYYTETEFVELQNIAKEKGITQVISGVFIRSSYLGHLFYDIIKLIK